jgi:hypothetical protein
MTVIVKDPQARFEHGIDWSAAHPDPAMVAASSWTVEPLTAGGLVVVASAFDLARTSVSLGGGVVGTAYRVANRVTLSDGQIDERSVTVRVEQR